MRTARRRQSAAITRTNTPEAKIVRRGRRTRSILRVIGLTRSTAAARRSRSTERASRKRGSHIRGMPTRSCAATSPVPRARMLGSVGISPSGDAATSPITASSGPNERSPTTPAHRRRRHAARDQRRQHGRAAPLGSQRCRDRDGPDPWLAGLWSALRDLHIAGFLRDRRRSRASRREPGVAGSVEWLLPRSPCAAPACRDRGRRGRDGIRPTSPRAPFRRACRRWRGTCA